MDDLDDDLKGHVILSCGHEDDGTEEWDAMFVIFKDEYWDPVEERRRPAYSTGMQCRACREALDPAQVLPSIAAANAWILQD